MKKVFLMAALFAVSSASAQTTGSGTSGSDNNDDSRFHMPHKCPKPNTKPQVSYNSASTVLNVLFSGNGQGGKVEIYRSGVKVVNTSAPADASLSFVLRNYGKGDYTVIVSSGNTVVYSNYVTVK